MHVGGPLVGQRNVLSGVTTGVILSSENNVVQNNFIGTDNTGNVNPNITHGVGISSTPGVDNLVGGTGVNEGNIIAGVSGGGILVSAFTIDDLDPGEPVMPYVLYPRNLSVLGNSIYDIEVFEFDDFGDMNQGIDHVMMYDHTLPSGDFRPDDVIYRGPSENGAFISQFPDSVGMTVDTPVLRSAQQVGENLTIRYDLDVVGSPNNQYRVEFFASDTSTIFGYGPGQTYLGSTTVGNGDDQEIVLDVNSFDAVGKALSATVTIVDGTATHGFGATSEFAQNISVGSASDFDSDGVSDEEENAAPNSGDGNNDGTQDSAQSVVSSYEIPNTNIYTTFVTDGCSENGTVSSLSESGLVESDGNYEYPYGLTDFSLNCSRGATVNVTKHIFTDDEATGTFVRKYRPDAPEHFLEVPGSSVTSGQVGSETALTLEYSLTDGGSLDDDGEENGVIVDPVGIARVRVSSTNNQTNNGSSSASGTSGNSTSANGTLATTGAQYAIYLTHLSVVLLLAGVSFVGTVRMVSMRLNRRQ